jgi:urease accessory protein UreH
VGEFVTRSSEEAARISDAEQAAYFHQMLTVEQTQLSAGLTGMRKQLEKTTAADNRIESNRLRFVVRQLENELSHVEYLLQRLEKRFSGDWHK